MKNLKKELFFGGNENAIGKITGRKTRNQLKVIGVVQNLKFKGRISSRQKTGLCTDESILRSGIRHLVRYC